MLLSNLEGLLILFEAVGGSLEVVPTPVKVLRGESHQVSVESHQVSLDSH